MLGLVSYDSDDDQDNVTHSKENGEGKSSSCTTSTTDGANLRSTEETGLEGPVLGPAAPDATTDLENLEDEISSAPGTPRSPYTQSRQLIHSLTLPPLPNVSIPASPPGSPRPSTSAKVERFLDLKSQGMHFNAKLASSSALKNPSLFQNLMQFAGIDEHDQYDSTLSTGLKPVPDGGFPTWAYVEELAKSQQEILRKRETEKLGERREFVAASGPSSGAGTPRSTGKGTIKGSTTERIMAGLDREKSRSPQVPMNLARKDLDQRRSRFDDRAVRRRSRSRSPNRRRDR